MKVKNIILLTIILINALLLGSTQAAFAQTNPDGPADPAELEAFLDELISAQMEEWHVPGVTVSVVKDGELFFAKGYGYADVEKGIAVDAENTLFLIGSLSKLFTWTSVMQLVEQDKLDLDADVNTYIDFEIPATYPESITMKHLMSHSAGFEIASAETWVSGSEQIDPLGEWLATHIPARVRRPSEVAGYSNYGTALAGYIVQNITGIPYEQYVQENILSPLGMTQSSAFQPVPSALAQDMASGYVFANDAYQPQAIEYINIAPAGVLKVSGTDAAKFMLAHLQDGRYSETQILEPATAQQMHSTLFTHDPRLDGIAHGFIEGSHNGQRMLSHGGTMLSFKSNLVLLPDQNVGIFISGNSANAEVLRFAVPEAFIDRYYPAPDTPALQRLTDVDLSRFVGSYRTTRSSYTKIEKAAYILSTFDIGATADGLLTFGYQQFAPVDDLVFQEVGGQDKLVFRQDAQGNITHAFTNSHPIWAYEKQEGLASTSLQHTIILFCLTLCVLTLVIWLVSAFINRRKGKTQPQLARIARWVSVGTILLNSAVVAGLFLGFPSMVAVLYGNTRALFFIPLLASLAAVLTLGAIIFAGLAWKQKYWTLAGRIHYTLIALVGLGFAGWLNYWNLIGWKF